MILEINSTELLVLLSILEREVPKELKEIDNCPEFVRNQLLNLGIDKANKSLLEKVTTLEDKRLKGELTRVYDVEFK